MPELPEVETVVRALRPQLEGAALVGVVNSWPRHIATPTVPQLRKRLSGCRIARLWRRAKYIVADLDCGQHLVIHLRMTGHLAVVPAGAPTDAHVHTTFVLGDGRELRFRDTRKFGKVYLVDDLDEILGGLGPEPLSDAFTVTRLCEILQSRRRTLKPLLLDQSMIAGIGNIYADEALFYAGIHPRQRSDRLDAAACGALHAAIRHVLQLGIAREGASIDSYVQPNGEKGDMQNAVAVFRRTGLPCYACQTPIVRIVLGGRSTHYCPRCQPLPQS